MRILVIFLISLMTHSCTNKKTENNTVFDSSKNYKISNDTLNIGINDSIKVSFSMPENNIKHCITDFNKFFEIFSIDSIFQKKWIKYPLKYTYYGGDFYEDLQIEYIDSLSYNFIDFSQDKYAIDSEYDKYTTKLQFEETEVIYQWLGYDNDIHIDYVFKKINNCWYLNSIENSGL